VRLAAAASYMTELRWNAACMGTLIVGGLRYPSICLDRDGSATFAVSRQRAFEFAFWLQTGSGNTVCSLTAHSNSWMSLS
jgi:hypothetical protein